ncbi:MAG: DUF975 family protein [Eubacteriales bacterium]
MKQEAKALLKTQKTYQITGLYLLGTTIISAVLQLFVPNIFTAVMTMDMNQINEAIYWGGGVGLFLSVLVVLFGSVMTFGYQRWALKVASGESPPPSSLIEGFAMTGKVLFLEVLKLVFMYFWMLCFMTGLMFPILGLMLFSGSGEAMLYLMASFMEIGVILLMAVGMIWLQIRYCFAPFYLVENPEKGAFRALKSAVAKQRSCFKALFKFHLSFLPWLLLYFLLMLSYSFFTIVIEFVMGSAENLSQDELLTLAGEENVMAYLLSVVLDCLFMLKFLPLYFVSLGLFFRKEEKTDTNHVEVV